MPIRLRLAGLFAVAAMVLAAAGGTLFLQLLRDGLMSATDTNLTAAADPIVQTVADTGARTPDLPDLPTATDPSGIQTQVISADGTLVDPSPRQITPLLSGGELASARVQRQLRSVSRASSDLRLLSVPVRRSDGVWVVVVAESLTPRTQALIRVRTELLISGALVVTLGTVGAWLLAGAALRPVERMRRSVTDIRTHDPAARVSEPATRDELSALARTFNELLSRLQDALSHQRQFVADAGHELRGPLSVLRAELELAGRPYRTRDELVQAVGLAAEETERLARLADDLLLLARSDDGALLVHATVQPIESVLRTALAARQHEADRQAVTLRISIPAQLRCRVDADRLRHAVDNVLDNALRVTPPAGTIALSVVNEDRYTTIEVADTGPGFPAEFLPHAFERFRRSDHVRSQDTGGAGLGLAIVHTVAVAHGGNATASNRIGGTGAVITIRLPAPSRPATADEVPSSAPRDAARDEFV